MEHAVRYASPERAAEERDLLLLEQEQWSRYRGLLTRAGLLRYMRASLYGTDESARVDCGGDGDLVITLYAWPLAPDVVFRLRASAGVLGAVTVDTVPAAESVSFQLSDRASLRRPATRITALRWLTGPYDGAGRLVPAPSFSVSGRELSLSAAVWGTAWVESVGTRYACGLTIPLTEAEPLLAAGWSEYALGLPEGGRPVALALTPPPGAESLAAGAECGRASVSYRVKDGETPPPRATPANKYIECDYCSLTCGSPTYG